MVCPRRCGGSDPFTEGQGAPWIRNRTSCTIIVTCTNKDHPESICGQVKGIYDNCRSPTQYAECPSEVSLPVIQGLRDTPAAHQCQRPLCTSHNPRSPPFRCETGLRRSVLTHTPREKSCHLCVADLPLGSAPLAAGTYLGRPWSRLWGPRRIRLSHPIHGPHPPGREEVLTQSCSVV